LSINKTKNVTFEMEMEVSLGEKPDRIKLILVGNE
jgi:hypothetical protein